MREGLYVARRRLVGVIYLVVLGLLLALTVAIYQKKFTSSVSVTLRADHIGNQLSSGADVKLRGVFVGEVRKVHSICGGGGPRLGLHPGKAKRSPGHARG